MKFVLCDDDALMRNMVETLIERQGHELIAAVVNTADATDLIVKHRPDAVIVDLSLGYNTDFDIVDVATAVGSRSSSSATTPTTRSSAGSRRHRSPSRSPTSSSSKRCSAG